jgi:hypothetical protein
MNEEHNNENNKDIIKTKIDFFLREKIKAHIDLADRSWLNGFFIKKFDKDDVYEFTDDVLGMQHLTLSEIKNVSTFRAPKKDGGGFKANNF